MDGPERTPGGSVFDRAARTYGTVGPDFFSYFGRRLVDRMGITKNGRVLDVACGTGAALLSAAEAVGAGLAVGADLSEPMLRLARGAAGARLGYARSWRVWMRSNSRSGQRASTPWSPPSPWGRFPTRCRHWRNVGGFPARAGLLGLVVSDRWWWEGDDRWGWHSDLLESLGVRIQVDPFPSADISRPWH